MAEERRDAIGAAPAGAAPAGESWPYRVYDGLVLAASAVALPLLPLLFLSKHRAGLEERLGRLSGSIERLHYPVWIHAASVGEVLSTEPLIRELRRAEPTLPILISTTTVTGKKAAVDRLAADAVTLMPIDHPWLMSRTVARLAPRLVVVVETEIWPAMIRAAKRNKVPVVLVSGRLSEAAAGRYRRLGWFFRAVLAQLDLLVMQTQGDADRMVSIGAPPNCVSVIGSLKFARTGTVDGRVPAFLPGDRPVLIAASTHPGEEDLALDACRRLWEAFPDALLIVAPRRPERFAEVAKSLDDTGVSFRKRSAGGEIDRGTRVLLLDTLGELADCFGAARGVFVGGTMGEIGGHNVLEPSVSAVPVAFGPDTRNVQVVAAALLEAGAAVRVVDSRELAAHWGELLADPAKARAMGSAGRAVVERQEQVAVRTVEAIRPYLAPRESGAKA